MNWIWSSQQSWSVRKGAENVTSDVRRDNFCKAVGGRRVRGFQQASGRVLGVGKGLHNSRSLKGQQTAGSVWA